MIWIIGSIVGLVLLGIVGSSSSGSETETESVQTDLQSIQVETQATPVPEETQQPTSTPTQEPSYPAESIIKLEEARATPKAVARQETITTTSGGDKDCPDFSSHEEAQAYFLSKGGSPSNNVDRLDRDRDGLACEDN